MTEIAFVLRYKEDIVFHAGQDRESRIPCKGQYLSRGNTHAVSTPSLRMARMYRTIPKAVDVRFEVVRITMTVMS